MLLKLNHSRINFIKAEALLNLEEQNLLLLKHAIRITKVFPQEKTLAKLCIIPPMLFPWFSPTLPLLTNAQLFLYALKLCG